MNIHELATYNLDDAVKFHRRLNPVLWGRDEHLLPEVRDKLLRIAADFQEFLGVEDLKVKDITVSGSNAAYSYTKQSDIDLHLVVEMPDDPVYQELFAAKKYQYNNEHDITIGGADVELYVQPEDQPHHSQGIYSIKNSDWVKVPQRKRSQIDDTCVLAKVDDLTNRIQSAVASQNKSSMDSLWNKIKTMRQSGLENHGEFGCENVAFKLLRNNGSIGALKSAITAAQDRELSLPLKKRVRYGFSEDVTVTPDGVSASTNMFLNETPIDSVVQAFIKDAVQQLNIEHMPEVVLHNDASWSKQTNSFGQYNPGTRTLHVSLANRHLLDILRTVAHELTHCRQNELNELPDDAGETGSPWENEANAQAGILMRDFADANPEYFTESYTQAKSLQSSMKTFRAMVRIKDRYGSPAIEAQVVARNHDMARQLLRAQYGPDSVVSTVTELKENASGYIPKNKREAARPQYAMALSVDIKPGQVGKEANKLGLKTGRNGEPGLLMPEAQNLLREFAEFTEEQDNLFEIIMSPSSLKKLSAQTGALAGMEFEMIVPNIEGSDDGDQEPDYEYDERCRSIEDAVQFFHDGDFNGRRDVERLRDKMQNDFQEWLDDKLYQDWERNGEEYLEEWVPNNVDESEWNPEGLEGDERQEALEELIANMHADPGGSDAFDQYREENFESYDESDWLNAESLDMMSSIENNYNMNWPHWRSIGGGETSIEDVADSFRDAVGRPILASTSYHSGRVERPSTTNLQYIVEPDGSLNPDDSDDQGLEFVSPPLPIEELLSDLNKVKAWADRTGCYTNDSTGLHINVSVPGWTGGTDQLDYVKLALLLGDEFVLDSFGRAGNTYAKSAMGKIRDAVRKSPDRAKELMDKMKSGMDQLASKVVHSRSTEKYTSINVKDGYIEFRSPGGDWLNDNFAEIDNTLRRFTVALSAAVDPEAYRQEYLKKLYKLLDPAGGESKGLSGKGTKDTIKYFADYVAGLTPKAALRSFVRQAQLERDVKRGKEQPAPVPSAQEPQGVDTRVDYELYSRASGAVIDTFPARNDDEAITRLQDYINFGAGQNSPDNFDVRRAPIAGSTLDLQRQRAAAGADAAQGGIIDIDLEPAPPPAGGEQFTGEWQIVDGDTGQELHRFSGIGNNQADANRVAANWLSQNAPDAEMFEIGVYPVMAESLTETNRLTLRDFNVKLSPHYRDRAHAKGVDLRRVDDVLFNLSKVKDKIMSLEPGRAFILHDGQGTGLGMRRHLGNRLTLATVYPVSSGFNKGLYPTFRVDTVSGINEDSEQKPVTIYTNPANQGATVDDSIKKSLPVIQVPFDKLQQWESHKTMQDPRVADWVNTNLLPQLQQNGTLDPLSVWGHDGELFVIDGNHRFVAYQQAGYQGRVPVQIVPDEMITIVDTVMNEQGMAEGKQPGQAVVDAILKAMPIAQEIWFHGSRATGKHRKNSDTDILVVVPDDLVGDQYLGVVRILQKLSRHFDNYDIQPTHPGYNIHLIAQEEGRLLWSNKQDMAENFHDGKNPGRKGLAKRSGVNTKASVSSLRKTAKNSSGEKQRMAHWLANMKAGRAKAKRK
jgi:predicted nucleotidyltransferase